MRKTSLNDVSTKERKRKWPEREKRLANVQGVFGPFFVFFPSRRPGAGALPALREADRGLVAFAAPPREPGRASLGAERSEPGRASPGAERSEPHEVRPNVDSRPAP